MTVFSKNNGNFNTKKFNEMNAPFNSIQICRQQQYQPNERTFRFPYLSLSEISFYDHLIRILIIRRF